MVMAYGVIFGHNGVTSFLHKREEARSLQLQMQQLQIENERLKGTSTCCRMTPAPSSTRRAKNSTTLARAR